MRTSRQDRSEFGGADEGRWRNRPEWSCRDARMRRFIFTEEVQQALAKDRYHHPDPRVQQRMEIVLLKSKGETHERIAELAGCRGGPSSVRWMCLKRKVSMACGSFTGTARPVR